MRQTLLAFSLFCSAAATAQTVADFEALPLTGTDSFYVNYTSPGQDVGFDNGLAHFPCVFDTSGGFNFLSYGFVYSRKKDSTTSGFANQYSAKAGKGVDGSEKYAVAFGTVNKIILKNAAVGQHVSGVYLTNNTYAHNSMRDGDNFSRKFGDTTGTSSGLPQGTVPDFFKVVIRGYRSGALTTDSVEFFLADYRAPGTANDYIIRDWRWVPLGSLGKIDSLQFVLSSSDNGQFGMNTPAYFCIDNFTTNETNVSVPQSPAAVAAKVYPNPAVSRLFVELQDNQVQHIRITDLSGRVVLSRPVTQRTEALDIAALQPGVYILQLDGAGRSAASRFVKK